MCPSVAFYNTRYYAIIPVDEIIRGVNDIIGYLTLHLRTFAEEFTFLFLVYFFPPQNDVG